MARHLAIGDIHGCFTALTTLADFVGFDSDDVIVTLGDYVDRGPDSRSVVEFVRRLGESHTHVPLRGNHEIMMLASRDDASWFHSWYRYGGAATLRSYDNGDTDGGPFADVPAAHIEFLERGLEPWFECETHIFVHAGVDPELAMAAQADEDIYWRKYFDPQPHCSGKTVVCGHTAQRSGLPANDGHAVCIDTWAHGEGWLTCLDIGSGTVYQANEAGATRKFAIEECGPG